MYKELLSSVEPQVKQLHSIFQQAKGKTTERIWIRNSSDGELDDTRLVEGVAGERLVFKKRAKAESKNVLEDERRAHTSYTLTFISTKYSRILLYILYIVS